MQKQTAPAEMKPAPTNGFKSASSPSFSPPQSPPATRDELARVFNTALISTQAKGKRDFSGELLEVTESASYKAILSAVRQLAGIHGMSERQAAEQIIQTFRKMDELWSDYVFREGLEKIRTPRR